MNLQSFNDTKCLFPLWGAFVGGYKGYTYALEKKQVRWGKYSHLFQANIVPIGLFTALGFGIGYCFSKLF